MTGVITEIMPSKGFGFIRDTENVSRFFHVKEVVPPSAFDHLFVGKQVSFTPQDAEKGPRAIDVTPC